MRIKQINYGTGNRVGDTIYINKDLKKYPGLYEAVLNHEKKHTGSFELHDLSLDLINEDIKNVRGSWTRFILTHPRSWINFFPIMKLEEDWTFDLSILFVWILMIIIFSLGWLIL